VGEEGKAGTGRSKGEWREGGREGKKGKGWDGEGRGREGKGEEGKGGIATIHP
jgi:hypothetical protein